MEPMTDNLTSTSALLLLNSAKLSDKDLVLMKSKLLTHLPIDPGV